VIIATLRIEAMTLTSNILATLTALSLSGTLTAELVIPSVGPVSDHLSSIAIHAMSLISCCLYQVPIVWRGAEMARTMGIMVS
jgi:hypothetical protein